MRVRCIGAHYSGMSLLHVCLGTDGCARQKSERGCYGGFGHGEEMGQRTTISH